MNNWFVVNDPGDIAGHDLSEIRAKLLASELQALEPEANWEALNNNDV